MTKSMQIELETCDQYTIQGDLFAQAILNNTPVPTPLEDAVANMRVIEAIVRSGQDGVWAERVSGSQAAVATDTRKESFVRP